MSQDTPLRAYVVAGRYEILHIIEDRGSTVLYQGRDRLVENGAYVLLKHSRQTGIGARLCFDHERQRQIAHPHLAPRLASDWFDGNDPLRGGWQVFEWVEGRTLETWLTEHNNRADPVTAVQFMIQVCQAMTYLHQGEPSILHKHIAPASIGLTRTAEGRTSVFVREYGMTTNEEAVLRLESISAFRQAGRGAPEQFDAAAVHDERTDIYAIGATLYELVTGLRPAPGDHRRQYRSAVTRADEINSNVPHAVADAIERAMALDAQLRFNSVAELQTALQKAIQPVGTTDWFWLAVVAALVIMVAGLFALSGGNDTPTLLTTPAAGGIPPTIAILPSPLPPTPLPDVAATMTAADGSFAPIVGPLAGELPVTAAGPAAVLVAGSLADFAVAGTFVNPDSPAWEYGYAFRHDVNSHFRLSVAADGTWLVVLRTETPGATDAFSDWPVDSGQAPSLLLGSGEVNNLRLLVFGQYALFFVNEQDGHYINLNAKVAAGDVYVAAGLRGAANGVAVTYRELFVRGAP